ncbi:hypothetical protein [Micromonospora zamorensis]|uniref:hypothetical protein n=1 Tax=Micromonospora zamorensis TaxID=709883 RepID=UPI003CF0C282
MLLPGALPALFLGLRLAIGAAWLSLVVGEQVNAQTGIGVCGTSAGRGCGCPRRSSPAGRSSCRRPTARG